MIYLATFNVCEKKKSELIQELSFKKITEGKCVQIMHIGPYSTEPETTHTLKGKMK